MTEPTVMFAPRAPSDDQQSALTYHCAAIMHYGVLSLLVFGVTLATMNVAFALAAVVLGVLAMVGILPRLRVFRREVDARCERRAAGALRAALLGRMSPVTRDELEVLEGLVAGIRRRCESSPGGARATPDPTIERWLGLQKLLALYVELAVTHECNVTTFCARDRAALEWEGEQVWISGLGCEVSDPWFARRQAILRRRQETWQQATQERAVLVHGLATISGAIRWMHELCGVVVGDAIRSEVDDVLAAWESSGATLHELSSLRRHADVPSVDPRALALGREVAAQAAATARWRVPSVGTGETVPRDASRQNS